MSQTETARKAEALAIAIDSTLTCSLCGAPYGELNAIEVELLAKQSLHQTAGNFDSALDVLELKLLASNLSPSPSMRNLTPQGLKAITKSYADGEVRVMAFLLSRLAYAKVEGLTSQCARDRSIFVKTVYARGLELDRGTVAETVQLLAVVDSWCNFADLRVFHTFKKHLTGKANNAQRLFFQSPVDWAEGVTPVHLKALTAWLMSIMVEIETTKNESTVFRGNSFATPLIALTAEVLPGRFMATQRQFTQAEQEQAERNAKAQRQREFRIAYAHVHGEDVKRVFRRSVKKTTEQQKAKSAKAESQRKVKAMAARILRGKVEGLEI